MSIKACDLLITSYVTMDLHFRMRALGSPFWARLGLCPSPAPGPAVSQPTMSNSPGNSHRGCWELYRLQGLLQLWGVALQAVPA